MGLNTYLDSLTVIPAEGVSFSGRWNRESCFSVPKQWILSEKSQSQKFCSAVWKHILPVSWHACLTKKVNKQINQTEPGKHSNGVLQNNLRKHYLYSLICKQELWIRNQVTEQLYVPLQLGNIGVSTCCICQNHSASGKVSSSFSASEWWQGDLLACTIRWLHTLQLSQNVTALTNVTVTCKLWGMLSHFPSHCTENTRSEKYPEDLSEAKMKPSSSITSYIFFLESAVMMSILVKKLGI